MAGEIFSEGTLPRWQEKKTLKKPTALPIAIFLITTLAACGEKREANRKTDSDALGKVLATVNGVPITEYDVKQSLRRVGHGGEGNPETSRNTLEAIVRSELLYQQSIELGLDKNPEYRRRLAEAEAQLRTFQRQEMERLHREHIRNKAVVTDPEAREHFERNAKNIQTKYHIWQIYYRGEESRITEDYADLKRGMPFEKVASKRFPKLPKGMKAPWDLGFLYWFQIPPYWQDALGRLESGQASDIIKGPNERFWVIKVVSKTADPKITFDTEKGKIVEVLQQRKTEELHDAMVDQMRAKSKIVFPK
jgi:hypothetical protein